MFLITLPIKKKEIESYQRTPTKILFFKPINKNKQISNLCRSKRQYNKLNKFNQNKRKISEKDFKNTLTHSTAELILVLGAGDIGNHIQKLKKSA